MLDIAPVTGLKVDFDNFKSQSTNKKKMTFTNGTRITNATCDNIEMEDIRGGAYDFLAVDEYGNIDYKKEFMAAASQALKDKDRLNLMMIIGTPDLGMGEEFDEVFEAGQKDNDYIQSWHLTEDDCPFIDRESADVMNSLLDDAGRAREVFGEQIVAGGRLFPEFHFKTQVIPQAYIPSLPYFIGIDTGRRKPCVEFIQPDGMYFRVFHEFSGKNILVDTLVEEIKLVIETICQNNQPTIIGIDKAGKNVNDVSTWTSFLILKEAFPQSTFKTAGQLVSKDNQTHLYRKLTIQNRIWVDPSCKMLATAFIKATPNVVAGVIKPGWAKKDGYDDPLDALIYGLINHNPGLIIAEKKVPTLTPFERQAKADAFFGNT